MTHPTKTENIEISAQTESLNQSHLNETAQAEKQGRSRPINKPKRQDGVIIILCNKPHNCSQQRRLRPTETLIMPLRIFEAKT